MLLAEEERVQIKKEFQQDDVWIAETNEVFPSMIMHWHFGYPSVMKSCILEKYVQ